MSDRLLLKKIADKFPRLWKIYLILDEFSNRLDKHHVFIIAAGIAFNLMMYSLPLVLISIYIVDLVFGVSNIIPVIKEFSKDILPPTQDVQFIVAKILDEASAISQHSTMFGIIGIIALFWVASLLISSLRSSLNVIFEFEPKHNFLIYRLKDILLTILLTVTIFLSTYVLPLFSFLSSIVLEFVKDLHFLPGFVGILVSNISVSAITLILSFLVFFIIYGIIPNQKLPRYVKFYGSLISAGAIEFGRHLFGWYITSVANYGKFYGTFAIIVSLAVWIYYSSLIILFSAEIVKYIHDIRINKSDNKVKRKKNKKM